MSESSSAGRVVSAGHDAPPPRPPRESNDASVAARRGAAGLAALWWRQPWSRRRLWAVWAASRAVLLTLALAVGELGAQHSVTGDIDLYRDWGERLVGGDGLPSGDEKWQYPPGAAVVFAAPAGVGALTGLPYRVGFALLMLAVDAALTAALARAGGTGAARVWLVGTTALGPVTLARFDLVPAACVVAGLVALAAARGPRWGRAGFAVGLGALVKAWPAALLVALGRPRAPVRPPLARFVAGLAAAAASVVALLAAAGAAGDLLGFLDAQQARGLQLEAVAATPYVVARMLGLGEASTYSYGALQFDDSLARAVATACSLVELAVLAAAALWWWAAPRRGGRPATGPGAAGPAGLTADRLLALVLLLVLTSRVLSPQYLIWVLAVLAAGVALAGRAEPAAVPAAREACGLAGADGGAVAGDAAGPGEPAGAAARVRRRRAVLVALLLVAALLSQIVYPWRYNDVIQGRVVASLLLVVRNVLLVVAGCYAVRLATRRS